MGRRKAAAAAAADGFGALMGVCGGAGPGVWGGCWPGSGGAGEGRGIGGEAVYTRGERDGPKGE